MRLLNWIGRWLTKNKLMPVFMKLPPLLWFIANWLKRPERMTLKEKMQDVDKLVAELVSEYLFDPTGKRTDKLLYPEWMRDEQPLTLPHLLEVEVCGRWVKLRVFEAFERENKELNLVLAQAYSSSVADMRRAYNSRDRYNWRFRYLTPEGLVMTSRPSVLKNWVFEDTQPKVVALIALPDDHPLLVHALHPADFSPR